MAEEIKFSEEELKSLSELSQGYKNIQSAFGQLRVQKILLEQQKERDLVKELNDKYGPGQLDPQSGVFTPVPQDEAQEEASAEEESAEA